MTKTSQHAAADQQQRDTSAPPAQVWFSQDKVWHYRLPIWDRLIEKNKDAYTLKIFGRMDGDHAFGGGSRPYLNHRDLDERSFMGQTYQRCPDMIDLIQRERPDVLVMENNIRNLGYWKITKAAPSLGLGTVGWTKVQSFSNIPTPILQVMKKRFYLPFDALVVYGQTSFDELVALGYPPEKIRIANNTIDTNRIFEDADELIRQGMELKAENGLEGKRIMLNCATMYTKKRQTDLIEAWKTVREWDDDLHLVFVGGGSNLERVREAAHQTDPERIHVLGRVPEGEDYLWIGVSDINVFCGGLGLAINQCLAFGKPTIVADEPGPDSEIVRHNETGWRYERENIQALIDMIKHVMNDEAERTRICANARKLMREEVSIDNMVDKIDSAIRLALEASSQRRMHNMAERRSS